MHRKLFFGSSPRAWGIHRLRCEVQQSHAVHPHGRGEYTVGYGAPTCQFGSSPRAWGIRRCVFLAHPDDHGSSPRAWGIRCRKRRGVKCRPVHPHGRGEYAVATHSQKITGGSSPRAWGIRRKSLYRSGKTAVHPHGRGEYG